MVSYSFCSSPAPRCTRSEFVAQPCLCCLDLRRVEVFDLGHRERLADLGHPLLPSLLTDQCDLVDFRAVGGGELDIVPQCAQIPAVKVMKLRENIDLSVFRDFSV